MPKLTAALPKSEWFYPIIIDQLDGGAKTFEFRASEQERIDLARRFGVTSIATAEAKVTLNGRKGGNVYAKGWVKAILTQACVVSLVPIESRIEEEFESWFADKEKTLSFAKARQEREAQKNHIEAEILDESEDPEPIINGQIDLGELAAQYLSLAIDPYPHAEGVSREYLAPAPSSAQDGAETLRKNPFEALKDWKEKR